MEGGIRKPWVKPLIRKAEASGLYLDRRAARAGVLTGIGRLASLGFCGCLHGVALDSGVPCLLAVIASMFVGARPPAAAFVAIEVVAKAGLVVTGFLAKKGLPSGDSKVQ